MRPLSSSMRNTSSPHLRGWLKPKNRCLVPANSFAEYAPEPNPETKEKDVVWFALDDDRPLFAFAGIWADFKGDRGTKSKPIPGPHRFVGVSRRLKTNASSAVANSYAITSWFLQTQAFDRARPTISGYETLISSGTKKVVPIIGLS
jgi:hypothetical protein